MLTRHSRRIGTTAGFTLVEVLVALVVMATMAVMAWQGVDGIVRARNASETRLDQTLRLNTALAQWEQDLASIQDSSALPLALTCDGATVRLSRRTPAGMQVVAWSLKPEESGTSTWQRWASPATTLTAELGENWLRSLQLQGTEPGQIRVVEHVAQWQVYFYQGNAWANCQSSGDVEPAGNPGSNPPRTLLPSGVRLVLGFAPGSHLTGNLTRDTLLLPR